MLITYSTPHEYLEIFKSSVGTKTKYARKYQMPFKGVVKDSSDPYLEKLLLIREALLGQDFVFFTDCDSFIVNDIPFEEFMNSDHLVIAGYNNVRCGDVSVDFNSGNMVLKHHDLTFEFLDKAIQYYGRPYNLNKDQGAIQLVLSREAGKFKPIVRLDARLNKTEDTLTTNDLIVHLFDKEFRYKLETCKKWEEYLT